MFRNLFRSGYVVAAVLSALLTLSCAGGKKGDVNAFVSDSSDTVRDSMKMDSVDSVMDATPVPKAADEFFNDFIFSYTTSRRYQFARTVFPLPFIHGGDTTYIPRNKWKFTRLHTREAVFTVFFDAKKSLDLQKDRKVSVVKIEWFFMKTRKVHDLFFSKLNGEWRLRSVTEYPLDNYHDKDFITFYQRFATDSAYQREHLNSEITFNAPDPEDDFERMEGVITGEQWPSFCPELPRDVFTNIEYGQKMKLSKRRVVALEGSSNGFQCLLFFRRAGNGWTLYRLEN